ncbi:MAG: hypothetical protein ACLPX9_10790 [Rhodomicrobium sp.]
MTNSASVSNLTLEFDNFLFARIEKNSEEAPLSVLSVLARLGVDPWEEAARLAQLPRLAAAKRLASMIAAIPGAPSAYFDAGTVSERLISLLPARPAITALPRLEAGFRSRSTSWFAVLLILAALLFVIKLIAANQ